MEGMGTVVVAALAALAGGGALGTVVVQGWLEVRRTRIAHRRERVQEWRAAIEANFSQPGPIGLCDTAVYSSLRPYLSDEVRRKVEDGRMMVVGAEGRGPNGKKHMLLDEVARIERKWGLV